MNIYFLKSESGMKLKSIFLQIELLLICCLHNEIVKLHIKNKYTKENIHKLRHTNKSLNLARESMENPQYENQFFW